MKYLVSICVLLLLMACGPSNDAIDKQFEREFQDAIAQLNGTFEDIHIAPDWKAEAYFKDGQLSLYKEWTMPENGYTLKRVYLNKDAIDKIVYRTDLPVYSQSDEINFIDSLFLMYPSTKQVIRYYDSQLVDTIIDPQKINRIFKDIAYTSNAIQKEYDQRKKE